MKWIKLGKIFDPTEHTLPNRCVDFAQSPRRWYYMMWVRVYFSARERDALGKYLVMSPMLIFSRDMDTLLGP